MRMWMVHPQFMCRTHLFREHRDLHGLVTAMRRRLSLQVFVDRGTIEPVALEVRHDQLVEEMEARGYHHETPLDGAAAFHLFKQQPDEVRWAVVDRQKSYELLIHRCPACFRQSRLVMQWRECLWEKFPSVVMQVML